LKINQWDFAQQQFYLLYLRCSITWITMVKNLICFL